MASVGIAYNCIYRAPVFFHGVHNCLVIFVDFPEANSSIIASAYQMPQRFAVTLAIGLLLSLFTALTCSRTILRVLMSYSALRQPTYFLPATQLPAKAAP